MKSLFNKLRLVLVMRRRRVVSVVLFLLLVSLLAGGFMFYTARQSAARYHTYSTAADEYIVAAYKPAVEENPIRQEITKMLAAVLAKDLSVPNRLEYAQKGLDNLKVIEREVDAIKDTGDAVTAPLTALEDTAQSIGSLPRRGRLLEIVDLAKKEAQIISDIRGLSYRADYYTGEVFNRIIDDQGKLTDQHINDLNDQLPQLEDQFNKRTNLYTELEDTQSQISKIAHSLGYEDAQAGFSNGVDGLQ